MTAVAWFGIGVAFGFLFCAVMSFVFNGLFGYYYLATGGFVAVVSMVVALRPTKATMKPAVPRLETDRP